MRDEYIPLAAEVPIQIQEVPANVFDTTEWESYKTERWERLCRERGITENATLLRVEEAQDSCVLVSPSITYRDIVGLRYGAVPPLGLHHALSAIAVVQTADDYLLLQVRDSGDWPHSYELPGGFVRAKYMQTEKLASVDSFIKERASGELAPLSLHAWQCCGAIRYSSILEHMYVYTARTQEMAADVRVRLGEQVITVAPSDIEVTITEQVTLPLPLHSPSQTVLRHVLATQMSSETSQMTTQQPAAVLEG